MMKRFFSFGLCVVVATVAWREVVLAHPGLEAFCNGERGAAFDARMEVSAVHGAVAIPHSCDLV